MNKLRGYIYLASFSASVVFAEYEMLQRFGGVVVTFASACALTFVAAALYRAPEGQERVDGMHIRTRKRPSGLISAVRSSHRQLKRGWT